MKLAHWAAGIAAIAAMMGGTSAIAADLGAHHSVSARDNFLGAKAQRPWQGLSVGLLGAYGFGSVDDSVTRLRELDGPLFGGFAGLHGQHGSWVFGGEFDASFGWMSADRGYVKRNLPDMSKYPAAASARLKTPTNAFGLRQGVSPRIKRDTASIAPDAPLSSPDHSREVKLPKDDKPSSSGVDAVSKSAPEDASAAVRTKLQAAPGSDRAKLSLDEFYTLRGRVGYAFDDLLLYGTGGLGIAHVKLQAEHAGGSYRSQTYGVTPVVGAGVAYRVSDDVSFRAEYLYALPFEVSTKGKQKTADGAEVTSRANSSLDGIHLIRFGISYHLPIN
ncbi:outer membrane protein [Rhodoligotrophos defluvii]|uniref:outer membrane protein n=1 Tax=Rhodoligotrophos defluvii TaxID=2561934 RepID=UPI0014855C71|nr:outer membrane beta-barrel protein [Rhodoligotrophos defluvii]